MICEWQRENKPANGKKKRHPHETYWHDAKERSRRSLRSKRRLGLLLRMEQHHQRDGDKTQPIEVGDEKP